MRQCGSMRSRFGNDWCCLFQVKGGRCGLMVVYGGRRCRCSHRCHFVAMWMPQYRLVPMVPGGVGGAGCHEKYGIFQRVSLR
ncbi:unnamed protein product [Linum trigynum]|uniref:Uncharacterized protein n=1 Tax=Linum trigynum TaxID=586398 RepID=A0AAV2FKD0_9ROSI